MKDGKDTGLCVPRGLDYRVGLMSLLLLAVTGTILACGSGSSSSASTTTTSTSTSTSGTSTAAVDCTYSDMELQL